METVKASEIGTGDFVSLESRTHHVYTKRELEDGAVLLGFSFGNPQTTIKRVPFDPDDPIERVSAWPSYPIGHAFGHRR